MADEHAKSNQGITISVTAPGRVGASRLDVHCSDCGAQESRYVPRGTVSIEHVCGDGWRTSAKSAARDTGRATDGTTAKEAARKAG